MVKEKIRSLIKGRKLLIKRRKEILPVAAKLFLRKGYGGTSMQELAQTLGMSKVGLYNYIGKKEDIIHLIVEYSGKHDYDICKKILRYTQQSSPIQSMINAITVYITGVDENQDVLNFINHVIASFPHEYRRKIFNDYTFIVDTFEKIIQKGSQDGEFKNVNANLIAHNMVLAGQAWAYRRWLLRKHYTLEEYIKEQTEIVLSLLKNESRTKQCSNMQYLS
ncbi:TetR/AcrR family transcriptional regulator [Chloroflexota bacterium]